MPDIHIIIADAALRDAIKEALKLAEYGSVHESPDLATALKATQKATDTTFLILDEGNADKKTTRLLHDHPADEKIRGIFFLGTKDESWNTPYPIESFPKPLRLGHLLGRLSFHFTTRFRSQADGLSLGPWRLELYNRQIVHQENADIIRLTEKEAALLDYLAQSDKAVGREELLAAIWGHDGRIDTHTLETHIYQLRRKLDPEGNGINLLVNENGAYRLRAL